MSLTEIGARLRQRREELGVSLQTAQAATKIRLRYLQALETGDESIMPGYAYAKGFLRIYANYLGLDSVALLEEYRAAREGMVDREGASRQRSWRRQSRQRRQGGRPQSRRLWQPGRGPSDNRVPISPAVARARKLTPSRRRRQQANLLAILLILVLLAVAVVAAYFVYLAAQQPVDDRVAGDNGMPEQKLDGDEPAAAEEERSQAGEAGEANEPVAADPPPSDASPPTGVTVEAAGDIVRYGVSANFIKVAATVTERCWVRVESDGALVMEQTLTPGMTVNWDASSSLRVRAGNPAGLHLIVNDNELGIPSEHGPRTLIFELAP